MADQTMGKISRMPFKDVFLDPKPQFCYSKTKILPLKTQITKHNEEIKHGECDL